MVSKVANTEPTTPAIHRVRPTISQLLPVCNLSSHIQTDNECSGAPTPDSRGYSGSPAPAATPQYSQQGHNQQPYYQDHQNPLYQQQQQQQQGYHDPNMPSQGSNVPYDPNAPEGERGLGGAIVGGLAGRFAGNRMGNHGLLGLVGGAIAGSKLQDKYKQKPHHGSHHSSGSSWGGKW